MDRSDLTLRPSDHKAKAEGSLQAGMEVLESHDMPRRERLSRAAATKYEVRVLVYTLQ